MIQKSKILGLSNHDDLTRVKKLFNNKTSSYLTKPSSFEEIVIAIETIKKGDKYVCIEIKNKYSLKE